jgi:hypothetical protein
VKAVAASDEISADVVRSAVFHVADPRVIAVKVIDADIARLLASAPEDLRELARRKVPRVFFEYADSGSYFRKCCARTARTSNK